MQAQRHREELEREHRTIIEELQAEYETAASAAPPAGDDSGDEDDGTLTRGGYQAELLSGLEARVQAALERNGQLRDQIEDRQTRVHNVQQVRCGAAQCGVVWCSERGRGGLFGVQWWWCERVAHR